MTCITIDDFSVRRTKVIDDESDYFATDAGTWLSKGEKEALEKRKEELHAQRHASRKDRKVTLDFAGRTVIEEAPQIVDMYDINDAVVQAVHYGARPKVKDDAPVFTEEDFDSIVNPDIDREPPKVSKELCF